MTFRTALASALLLLLTIAPAMADDVRTGHQAL